jgi:hypothetical protein
MDELTTISSASGDRVGVRSERSTEKERDGERAQQPKESEKE